MTLKNGFGKCSLFVFFVLWMKRSKHCLFVFPPKKTLMEKALFDWPIVLQHNVKARHQLISRKFFGHEVFSPECSLNQPKATRVCTNQVAVSTRLLFLFVRAFSFQGDTKIALISYIVFLSSVYV